MSVSQDWVQQAAAAVAAYCMGADAPVVQKRIEAIIERHCPFKRDTAYAPVPRPERRPR